MRMRSIGLKLVMSLIALGSCTGALAQYEEQARTIDTAKRMRLVREFEARAMEKAYAVPILYWNRIVVLSSRVHGWTISPLHMIYQDLADVWLAPAKK